MRTILGRVAALWVALAAAAFVPYGATALAEPSYSPPSGSITGIVTDKATGAPLANDCDLTIAATYADFTADMVYDASAYPVKQFTGCLDANGRYTITGLPTDRYRVEATDASETYFVQYLTSRDTPMTSTRYNAAVLAVTDGQSTTADFPLVQGGSIAGTVTWAATGQPMASDCDLQITITWSHGSAQAREHSVDCTDANGQFAVADAEPGDYEVDVIKPGYIRQMVTVAAGQAVTGIDASLVRGGRVRAVFRSGADGKVLGHAPNALVNLPAPNSRNWIASRICRTSGSGALVVHDVPPGTWHVRGALLGLYRGRTWRGRNPGSDSEVQARRAVTVRPGRTSTVTLLLWPGSRPAPAQSQKPQPQPGGSVGSSNQPVGALAGVVKDQQTGAPLAAVCGIQIRIYSPGAGRPAPRPATAYISSRPGGAPAVTPVLKTWTGCLDAGGGYRIGGLPATYNWRSHYTLQVSDPQLRYGSRYLGDTPTPYRATFVAVHARQTTGGLDVTVPELPSISGTVYDVNTGAPISNFCDLTILVGRDAPAHVCTDANGGYTVQGVPAGFMSSMWFRPATTYQPHSWMSGETLTLAAGEHRTGVDVYLVPLLNPESEKSSPSSIAPR